MSEEVDLDQPLSEEQRDGTGDRKIGPERERDAVIASLEHNQADSNGGADDGREQDDQREHLPSHPCAERREQLEIAVAHSLLAANQLEQPVNDPQREITSDRTDDRGAKRHEQLEHVGNEARPQQRQREPVRKELGIEVDESERDECPQEHACRYALPSRRRSAETPDRRGREETAERFNERVTSRDWLAAGGALAAQQEPRCDRNVLECGDLVSARGAL